MKIWSYEALATPVLTNNYKNKGDVPCILDLSVRWRWVSDSCFHHVNPISPHRERALVSTGLTGWMVPRARLNMVVKYKTLALPGKAVPLHAMEAHGGERRYSSYSFLTSALDGGEWSASRPGRALHLGKEPPIPIG
jgi:hypothetical protein